MSEMNSRNMPKVEAELEYEDALSEYEYEIEKEEGEEAATYRKLERDRIFNREARRNAWLSIPVVVILASLSGWLALGFFVSAFLIFPMVSAYGKTKKKHRRPPSLRAVPTLPPSDNEVRLAQRLEKIDNEIMRHRRFLEESKPAYATNDESTQQNDAGSVRKPTARQIGTHPAGSRRDEGR